MLFAALSLLVLSASFIGSDEALAEPPDTPSSQATRPVIVAGFGTSPPLTAPFPEEYRGDTIAVGVLAKGLVDAEGQGYFTITHISEEGEVLAHLRGQIDCLRVEGDYAVMTGVVTDAYTPGVPNGELHVGTIAGIVIQDAGAQDTMIWAFDDVGSPCTEIPALTAVPVVQGGFWLHK
jgi:hypothetical protein